MGDHQFVRLGQRRERPARLDDVGLLDVGLGRLATFQQGVAAERGDDPHPAASGRRLKLMAMPPRYR
jgi:hypothetical protein